MRRWLLARADNVAVALLAAMFVSFVLQIVWRYVVNDPLSWTLEVCLTTWLWLVFWGSALVLREGDHVRFDMLYLMAGARLRRVLALAAAVAVVVAFVVSMPATIDYVTFYRIKSSATLGIRLDLVFSIYVLFAAAMIARYGWRAWALLRGGDPDDRSSGAPPPSSAAAGRASPGEAGSS
ncbi:MAG: TRAP transporter small permease [Lautropia sp.]